MAIHGAIHCLVRYTADTPNERREYIGYDVATYETKQIRKIRLQIPINSRDLSHCIMDHRKPYNKT